MSRPRIYIHRVAEWYPLYMDAANEARLGAFAEVVNAGPRAAPPTPGELARDLAGVDGILSLNGLGAAELTTAALAAAGTVRVAAIAHWWHGGHVPATAAWRAAGVAVLDVSDATTEAVVEWVVGALILGIRRMDEFDRRLRRGDPWAEPGRRDAGLLGESVVGLIGVGRVGRVVARRLGPFGATLLGYDPYLPPGEAGAVGVRLVSLDELLARSDAVSLHLPVTDATRGSIGARELARLRDGVVLVNSARAALLDRAALLAELRTGRIRAYLDVFDDEPLATDDPLRALDNVFLTPHIAGDTTGMFLRCGRLAIAALERYFAAPGEDADGPA